MSHNSHPHLMSSVPEVKTFALAGRARITLVSKKTNARFTYRLKATKDRSAFFVGVLTGPDNTSMYSYMGIIGKEQKFIRTAKSKIDPSAPSMFAFVWFWRHLWERNDLCPDSLEVWHQGVCGRCSRPLTVPESIARGIGPECADKMGIL